MCNRATRVQHPRERRGSVLVSAGRRGWVSCFLLRGYVVLTSGRDDGERRGRPDAAVSGRTRRGAAAGAECRHGAPAERWRWRAWRGARPSPRGANRTACAVLCTGRLDARRTLLITRHERAAGDWARVLAGAVGQLPARRAAEQLAQRRDREPHILEQVPHPGQLCDVSFVEEAVAGSRFAHRVNQPGTLVLNDSPSGYPQFAGDPSNLAWLHRPARRNLACRRPALTRILESRRAATPLSSLGVRPIALGAWPEPRNPSQAPLAGRNVLRPRRDGGLPTSPPRTSQTELDRNAR